MPPLRGSQSPSRGTYRAPSSMAGPLVAPGPKAAPFRCSTCSPPDPPGFTCLAPPTLPPTHSRTSQNLSCLFAGLDSSPVGYLELAPC
ncbi:Zyxin [Dissostichus eleginoides]|uniref:Zyxin n=1 Tax=Dissostichus eleginoides TaxID=100907 RepID=A0AAD9CQ02_DISEL|nr:Zyxin [Dissostichus eleginoides]